MICPWGRPDVEKTGGENIDITNLNFGSFFPPHPKRTPNILCISMFSLQYIFIHIFMHETVLPNASWNLAFLLLFSFWQLIFLTWYTLVRMTSMVIDCRAAPLTPHDQISLISTVRFSTIYPNGLTFSGRGNLLIDVLLNGAWESLAWFFWQQYHCYPETEVTLMQADLFHFQNVLGKFNFGVGLCSSDNNVRLIKLS